MAGRADIEAGKAFVSLYLRDSDFYARLNKASQRVQSFGASVTKFGRSAMTGGRAAIMASIAGLAPFGAAVKIFADYDDKIRAVRAVTGATEEEFGRLDAKAKELGRSTSFTAGQVGDLMTELGRAGFVADEIEQMTGAVLDLSRATGTDAAMSAGIMAASLRQFSMGAGDATRVADALTVAANKSFNTVEQLGEALSYAGPTAASFNMSIEDTLAILGALGNVGIQGSNAGTAVRRLLTITGAEAEKLQGIFGVTFIDAAGDARPLVDVMEDIRAATQGLGTAAKSQKFNEAFGLLGITGAESLSGNIGSVRALRAELEAANGTAAKTAAEMDAGLGGSFRILLSAVEGVAIAVGESLAPTVAKIAERFTDWAGVITTFVQNNAGLTKWIVGAIAVLGLLGTALVVGGAMFAGLGFAITGLGVAISVVSGAIAFLTSPLGIAVALATALTAAVWGGVAAWMRYTEAGQEFTSTVSEAMQPAGQAVIETIEGISQALLAGDLQLAGEIAMAGLRLALLEGLNGLNQIIDGPWGDLIEAMGGMLLEGNVQEAWNVGLEQLGASFYQFAVTILNYVDTIRVEFMGLMTAMIDSAAPIIDGMLVQLGEALDEAFGADVSGLDAAIQSARTFVQAGQAGAAASQVQRQANLEALKLTRQTVADAAQRAVTQKVERSNDGSLMENAQAEFAALLLRANESGQQARDAAAGKKGTLPGSKGGAGSGGGAGGGLTSSAQPAVTFSSAALRLLGGGGRNDPQQELVREAREARRDRKAMLKADQDMINALEKSNPGVFT